jgi:small subunit ribosomal protein S20
MPIKHAALKQLRKDKVRHSRNQAVQSELKTFTKQFLSLINTKKIDEARNMLSQLEKKYDRAASKHVIHRNTASRMKSRLTLRLNRSGSKR